MSSRFDTEIRKAVIEALDELRDSWSVNTHVCAYGLDSLLDVFWYVKRLRPILIRIKYHKEIDLHELIELIAAIKQEING